MDKRLFEGRVPQKHSAYHFSPDNVVAAHGSDASRGLALVEAQSRLQIHGPNTLPSVPPVPAWQRFLAQFRGPLTLLLLAAAAISLAVWWIEYDGASPTRR